MTPYWILFGYFALGCFIARGRPGPDVPYFSPGLLIGMLAIVLMIGLRDTVGVDWVTYERIFQWVGVRDLEYVVQFNDPGYRALNWLVYQLGAGIWLVNLLCAAVFTWGFWRFARIQPFPWIAVMIAVPYLIIVVAMNYTRQAVAIGFVLAGLASLSRGGGFWKYFVYLATAALFHSSALVALPLGMFGLRRNRLAQLALIPAALYALNSGLIRDPVDHLVRIYIDTGLQSEGTQVRVALCVVPALLFFLFRSRLRFDRDEEILWRNFSLAAFGLLALLFIFPSSTVVDRIALYLLPLQVVVFARLPFVLNSELQAKAILVPLFAAVLFVWLNFAINAHAWIPYRMFGW